MKPCFLIALYLFSLTQLRIFGQNCDNNLIPQQSVFGYRHWGNGRSSRCEGFYLAPVLGENLKLVRLTKGNFYYKLSSDEIIKVCSSFPCSSVIKIVSEAIGEKTYYCMDALLMPNDTFFWPVKDVLLPNHLDHNQIGLYGTIQSCEKYIPIKANHSDNTNKLPIYLQIQTLANLDNVGWSYQKIINDSIVYQSPDTTVSQSSYQPFEIIEIKLPDTDSDELNIKVFGRIVNTTQWEIKTYRIIIN